MKHIKTYRSNFVRVPSNNERKFKGKPMVRLYGKRKPSHSRLLPFI